MKPSLPPPFLPTTISLKAWGFDQPYVECLCAEDSDEVLREFLLYAQARSKGKPWRIHPEFENRSGRIRNLRVEYDAHRACGVTDSNLMMSVEYVVAVTEDGPLYSGSEGHGLFWLDLPSVSAFCPTMAEALRALSAVAPYVPVSIRDCMVARDRIEMEVHLWRCLHLSGGDKVREEAVRRKIALMNSQSS